MQNEKNIANAILRVLKYFNIFKFPLNEKEIYDFLDQKCTLTEVHSTLLSLVSENKIEQSKENYFLASGENFITRKEKGAEMAKRELKKARLISKVISLFPFVRMVSISGSLSKGYADEKTDIDYFIITNQHNLWTCRSMLHIMKKFTFLINMQHSFCMNYFIAEDKLTIEEQNYYTAVELSTLIPIYGIANYNKLMEANNWLNDFLPNYNIKTLENDKPSTNILKNIVEFILKSKKMSAFLMDFTDKRWKKKWFKKGISEEDYDISFKTRSYVSKNHPSNYQKIILERYQDK